MSWFDMIGVALVRRKPDYRFINSAKTTVDDERAQRRKVVSNYEIERDGLVIQLLTDRACQRGSGTKPALGVRLAFKTRLCLCSYSQT